MANTITHTSGTPQNQRRPDRQPTPMIGRAPSQETQPSTKIRSAVPEYDEVKNTVPRTTTSQTKPSRTWAERTAARGPCGRRAWSAPIAGSAGVAPSAGASRLSFSSCFGNGSRRVGIDLQTTTRGSRILGPDEDDPLR